MALFYSIGAALNDDMSGTLPVDWRKTLEGLVTGPGVLPGAASPLVSGVVAAMSYTVSAATWATPEGASGGVHLWGNDGTITVATDAAPGSGLSRIDVVYAMHTSNGENGATASTPTVAVAIGTPASSPVALAIPTNAIELARNTMTSVAVDTAGTGNTISQTATPVELVSGDITVGSVTAASGWSTTGVAYRSGGHAWLSGLLTRTGADLAVAGSFVQIGTVPVGARPTEQVYMPAMMRDGLDLIQAAVATNGAVYIREQTGGITVTTGTLFPLSQVGPYRRAL